MTEPAFKVDLSNCDREPIHILGAIQPFGFLLALSSDWLIARASANVAEFLGQPAQALIGQPASAALGAEAIHTLRNRMLYLGGVDAVERVFDIDLVSGRRYDVALHLMDGLIVIEAEPAQRDAMSVASLLRGIMSRLDQTQNLEAFFREGAKQARLITGFDRVMVYRFDTTGSGEVVAESARGGIGSFLGLHYPASDIPAQARKLYVRNPFRIIADIGAAPVPVVPEVDERGQPLDLSLAVTRAVSPIHIEYLKNMGVGASLSISIVVEGRLWGLFACHHYSPRLPSLERRSLAELFGQMFAMKLESRERQLAAEYSQRTRGVADTLLSVLGSNETLLSNPEWLGEIMNRAIESDGMGISIDGRLSLAGLTPTAEEFSHLLRALNGTAPGRVYATERIAELLPAAAQWQSPAVGMLSMPISRTPRDYIVLFRQEVVKTVRWAGDPHKPAEYGPNGPRLTPRKSFEAWAETVKGRSQPFSDDERKAAEMLRSTLIELVLRVSEDNNAERQLASERRELLIAELNHRVRNILSLIGGLVRRSRGSARSIDQYAREIDDRINALARAHNQLTREEWVAAGLEELVQTEVEAYIGNKSDHVQLEGPRVLLTPHAFSTLALVFHELVTNSAKYGGLSDNGRVALSWHCDESGNLHLHWREHGGPAVQAPTRQGFGSTIIRRSVPYDLGGTAELKFNLAGVEARFMVPARHLERKPDPRAAAQMPATPVAAVKADAASPRDRPLAGRTVLLLEDSHLIAIDTEESLRTLGAAEILMAASAPEAFGLLDAQTPEFAVLDLNLGDHTSFPVAQRLHSLGIPFIFATGYGSRVVLPADLAGVKLLQKPYTVDTIAAVARTLFPSEP